MSARALFDAALSAARDWYGSLPAAREFCDWPEDLVWADRAAFHLPAADLIASDPGQPNATSAPLMAALQTLVPYAEWRHNYTADEVGQDFLNRFCWCELAGPHGHFHSDSARLTVGYWGPGLYYPPHNHAPAELYTVVSGQALFHAEGEADLTLSPGDTRLHQPNQPHALTTTDHPVLTFVLWRGEGLGELMRLSA